MMTQQHRTVLIISKFAEDREIYRRYLQPESIYIYNISEAESGAEGLRYCRLNKPDIILLDFSLADINGLDFLVNLSELMADSQPPVIMITGQGNESVAVKAVKSGVYDYLVRDETTPEFLLQAVRGAIENTELRQKLKATEEQSKAALQKSEEQLWFLQQAANVGFWDWNLVTNTATCSDKYYELHGFELGTPISYEISLASVLEQDKQLVDKNVRQVLEQGTKLNIEFRILHPVWGVRWLAAIGQTFYNSEGRPYRMMGMVLDISERKKVEEELQQSQRFTQQIIETVPGLVYIYDLNEQRNVYVNRQIAELMGYTEEQVQAMGSELFTRLFHPEDLAQVPAHIEELLGASDTDVFEVEYRMLHANGEWRWFFTKEVVYCRAADGSVSQILGISQDITQRKRAEKSLQESEERFHSLAETIPHIVWMTDENGETCYVNKRWQQYTGLPPEQAMGRAWQQVIHQEDLSQVQGFWSENVYRNALSFETCYRVRGVDGQYRWNLVRGFPIKDGQNRLVQWFGTCTDIHEQKELELEKQKAREEAELANRAKDEFIAIVSHELRSPLNAIVGWTKLLKNRKFDPVIFSRGLETIERNTQSQVQLIEDLLDISRMVRGNLRLTMSSVNLATVVETTVNSQRFLAEARQQELKVEIKSDSYRILGDINRLQQIVNNLVSNAIKFTPNGGRVEICLEQVDGDEKQLTKKSYAQIRVTDTGQGIDPDFLPHIFERFSQAVNSTTRGKDGLGLGLAIVHHLVELHGGNVNAFSEGVGQGATFTVVLPLLEDEKIRI